jgi:L-amino acid N-acyltransferase
MVRIRPAIPADAHDIAEIANALLHTTTYEWTEHEHTPCERRRWLDERHHRGDPVLVAHTGDAEVVGWASYADFRDSGRWPGYRFTVEHSIHVRESHWGRGVGGALLLALADHARAAGKRVMVAAIDSSNERSLAFHVGFGFQEVARMPGIGEKWGKRLDLVLVQRELDDATAP